MYNRYVRSILGGVKFDANTGGGSGGEGQEGGGAGDEGGEGSQDDDIPKFASKSELDSFLDKHAEKAVKTREKNLRLEIETEFKQELEKEKNLAALSAEDRKEAEFQAKLDELTKKEQLLIRKELKNDAVAMLTNIHADSRDLIAESLLGEDAVKTNDNIKSFLNAYNKAVEQGVNNALKDNANPQTGNTSPNAKSVGATLAAEANASRNAKVNDLWK
ncbi:DUF4355 domain-containing protein [Listeria weihenstephanensis]|uniref:DUF4355 domain-containing protein n=1 Tax=Listeria weihenstephanensis TaxID=1006155 RepID=A0A841Z2H8_9LIST|nr:DUF4355 domain-containing protein [Listeria weihenstephanensis]MBC1499398.1 DUF4355 domain-containing protein [Listeria weihenstephanensis]